MIGKNNSRRVESSLKRARFLGHLGLGYGNDSFFLEPLNKPSSNENDKKVS